MTLHQVIPSDWSLDLQKQTREAIEEMHCDSNGLLHFKHKMYGYAAAEISDLLRGQFLLTHKSQKINYAFSDCNDLIKSGWCID